MKKKRKKNGSFSEYIDTINKGKYKRAREIRKNKTKKWIREEDKNKLYNFINNSLETGKYEVITEAYILSTDHEVRGLSRKFEEYFSEDKKFRESYIKYLEHNPDSLKELKGTEIYRQYCGKYISEEIKEEEPSEEEQYTLEKFAEEPVQESTELTDPEPEPETETKNKESQKSKLYRIWEAYKELREAETKADEIIKYLQ